MVRKRTRKFGLPEENDPVIFCERSNSEARSVATIVSKGPQRFDIVPYTKMLFPTQRKRVEIDEIDGMFLSMGEALSALRDFHYRFSRDGNADLPSIITEWGGVCNERKYTDDD